MLLALENNQEKYIEIYDILRKILPKATVTLKDLKSSDFKFQSSPSKDRTAPAAEETKTRKFTTNQSPQVPDSIVQIKHEPMTDVQPPGLKPGAPITPKRSAARSEKNSQVKPASHPIQNLQRFPHHGYPQPMQNSMQQPMQGRFPDSNGMAPQPMADGNGQPPMQFPPNVFLYIKYK